MGMVLFMAGLAVLTFVLSYLAVRRNLPERLEMPDAEGARQPMRMLEIEDQFFDLGFERCGPMMRPALSPAPLVVPLYNARERCFASVYFLQQGNRVDYDIVSLLNAGEGVLSSAVNPGAGALPLPDDVFVQIIPRATPAQLWQRHYDALRDLDHRGIGTRPASPNTYRDHLRRHVARLRETFLKRQFWNTLVAIYRSTKKTCPQMGPLNRQDGFDGRAAAARTMTHGRDALLR